MNHPAPNPAITVGSPLSRTDGFWVIALAGLVFLFRWVTLDFDNDYFMHVSWAAEMLRGQLPVRDFVEPGFILQTTLAYLGLQVGGYRLIGEGIIACAFMAAGAGLTFVLARRLSIGRWMSLLVVCVSALVFPRLYTYPKMFVYPLVLCAVAAYAWRPSQKTLVVAGLATGVAFLFRHDHGLYAAVACVLGIILVRWSDWKSLSRDLLVSGSVGVLVAAPWLGWVLSSGHAGQYFGFLFRDEVFSLSVHQPNGAFDLDLSAPLMVLAPIDYPVVRVRWTTGTGEAERAEVASSHGLRPHGADPGEYVLTNLATRNVLDLIRHPAVDDTGGIDRGWGRAPKDLFPWLSVQAQRFLPFTRLRLLPGVIKAANARAWLAWLMFLLPWLVLATAALMSLAERRRDSVDRERMPGPRRYSLIITTAVLSIILYQMLVRISTDSRLGDVASLSAVLLGWLCGRMWPAAGWMGRLGRAVAVIVVLLTLMGAASYGRVPSRLSAAGITSPENAMRRTRAVAEVWGARPLDVFAPPGTGGLAGLSRWINECTAPGDRVAVVGFEPQVFVLSERGFAGGMAFYDLGWINAEYDQRLTLQRWGRQNVPVVLAMETEWEAFSRDYKQIRAWIDERYTLQARSSFGGTKSVAVFVSASAQPVRTNAATGLPCFR